MKKFLLLLLMLLLSMYASAYDIAVDNSDGVTIYYNFINDDKELEVTYKNTISITYQSNVAIPEEVTYMNKARKVTSIGERAFCNCNNVTLVTIPNSVTSIGSSAFQGCSKLTSVIMGNSVTSIRENAFEGCSDLTSVNISEVAAWCKINFSNNYSNPLYYANQLLFNGEEIRDLVIPNNVTFIGNYAFINCSRLTSVTIPDNVTSIGSSAFEDCSFLTSVIIGNSVTSIGENAFWRCSKLTSVNISDVAAWCKINFSDKYSNPLYYANHLFINGEELQDLVIPNSITGIGKLAFNYCTGLTSVTLGNSVTSIGESAFGDCTGLTSVNISNIAAWCKINFSNSSSNPLTYAHHLFVNREELKDLVIPNSITSIGKLAFKYCTGLTSVTIGNSVTSIGDFAFQYCTGLTSVTIGNSLTSIGENAFQDCSGLTTVNISDVAAWCKINFSNSFSNPLTYAHHLFINREELQDLVIPNNVTNIGNYAFRGCLGLTSITIPNSVSSIGDYTFPGCSGLTSVTIPNSVSSIGNGAFAYCSSLSSVTIGSAIKTIYDGAFSNCPELTDFYCYSINVPYTYSFVFYHSNIEKATLHVPSESISSYKAKYYWNDFKNIVALTDSDPKPTGISSINYTSLKDDVHYELSGRKTQNPQQGIYIINGKKCIKKK